MNRTYINEVQKEIGNTVKVQGFIENLRNSKYMAFIVLKDITGKLQITVEKEDHPDLVDTIDQLTPDSVITVTGKVVENDYVKMGGIEMIPEAIEVESIADALPIARKAIAATKKKKAVERSSIDQRIDYRWVDRREPADVQGPELHGQRHAQVPAGPELYRDPHPQADRCCQRERLRGVQGGLLRPQCLPGTEPPVLQADGNGCRL